MAEKSDERSIISEYELNANGMKISVSIYSTRQEFVPIYEVNFSGVTSATRLLLLSFRRELMSMVPFDPMHVQDSEYVKILNNKYMQASGILIV